MRWGLAIGGGGRNGAFAAGALYRLVSEYDLRFEAVSGTSTGALMAGPALLDQVEILNDLYRGGVTDRRILARRCLPLALLRGVSREPSRFASWSRRTRIPRGSAGPGRTTGGSPASRR